MSYARFGADGSDVYVFLSVGSGSRPHGWLECCSCPLQPEVGDLGFHEHTHATTTAAMLTHLDHHVAAGHRVSQHTIDALRRDAAANDASMRGELTEDDLPT